MFILNLDSPLLFGDNLEVLEQIPSCTVDLIYLDPPFNANRDFNVVLDDSMLHERAYRDTWEYGDAARKAYDELTSPTVDSRIRAFVIQCKDQLYEDDPRLLAYLLFMIPRLLELFRVLKRTGSIFLHCDLSASHYLKAFMDRVCGVRNFRSEITWKRTSAHNSARRFGPISDRILYYTKSDTYTWNADVVHPTANSPKGKIRDTHERAFMWSDLTATGKRNGSSGQPWRGYNPSESDRHWQIPKSLRQEYLAITGKDLDEELPSTEQIELLFQANLVRLAKTDGERPSYKNYYDPNKGVPLQDIWLDIHPVRSSDEYENFDGQKPEALLERIIRVASNVGDVVLDPFLGTGTTAVVAQRLDRKWIGIEYTKKIQHIIEERFNREFGDGFFDRVGHMPSDEATARALASQPGNQFENWINWKIGANRRRGPDDGEDGRVILKGFHDGQGHIGLVQVKGSQTGAQPGDVDRLRTTIKDHKAEMGVLVAFSFSDGVRHKASLEGTYTTGDPQDHRKFQRVVLITVQEVLDHGRKVLDGKVPSYIERPDYSQTKPNMQREAASRYNQMMEFPDD